ncbi:SAC3/GANP/Nin1/mts3/eIF-3 p25 family-domain-containing protein [Cyathus striatus]|nr:SAC3/GANP/Nin1/mts3/eIF-3 p25 family-domain-containing protein [Cyathus striatus]
MSTESWPPLLKEWVAKCLGQMTDSNRDEAQAELRQVIADAFASHTLWTTDWNGIQLKSLAPKPAINLNNLKRKTFSMDISAPTVSNKKAKKSALKNAAASSHTVDYNDQAALNRRAQRFQREHELERQKATGQSQANQFKNSTHLFNNNKNPYSRSASPMNVDEPEGDPNVIDWDRHTIVGTSQEVFKDYLRLTSEPKPEMIRPYAVLQKTLLELKKKWKEKAPYNWICNQFKSLRQDLTVQRIKNEFTVQVYEIHARMALESTDMVEYNQCQATLKTLYDLGIPGKVEEFTAYRILMLLHGRNRSELNLYVGQLTEQQKADSAVKHALAVQRALAMGNYHALFRCYLDAPNMGAYIMDHFIDRERVKALMVITKAYHTIPLTFLQNELAFDNLDQARNFLINHSAAFFSNPNDPDPKKILQCKPAAPSLTHVYEEKYRKVAIRGAI